MRQTKYVLARSSSQNLCRTTTKNLQLRPNSLQPILDILQRLRNRLPIVKLPHQLGRLRRQLRLDKVLLQQAPHDPRQVVRVGIRQPAAGPVVDLAGRDSPFDVRRLERVRHGQVVDLRVVVQARVALARVQAARERGGELADQAVVRDAEVAELEGEAD